MAIFIVDRKALTLTIHKDGCPTIAQEKLNSDRLDQTDSQTDESWYDEEQINLDEVCKQMNGRFWPIILCETCFRKKFNPA
jgi:hypothetical protein